MNTRQHLLAGAATALCLCAAPAAANDLTPDSGAGAVADETPADAPAPAADRFEPMSARSGKNVIRPFGGPFTLDQARTATRAGDLVGTAGRIRSLEDRTAMSAGRIRSLAGELQGFAGRIRSLTADPTIGTYYTGYNASFWGNLYAHSGQINASAGRIRSLDGSLETMAGRIRSLAGRIRSLDGTLLSFDSAPADYTGIRDEIASMVLMSKGVWGSAVSTRTGKTFEAAFSDPMLAKWGIRLGDARSVAGMNEVDLELFLLDWRDNLNLYSGIDSADWWMKAVNWTPATTHQLQGGINTDKTTVKVGLLDFSISAQADIRPSVRLAAGTSSIVGDPGHGVAVGGLIAAPHDGRGVMGMAPKALVYSYNPFDATMTGGWQDIINGLQWLGDDMGIDAHVINLSLGVPGFTFHQGWQSVLGSDAVKSKIQDAVFVIAAGNDGIRQTTNVNMKGALDGTFVVVGSVGPDNLISSFSNTPGSVCLTDDGVCKNTARWTKANSAFLKSDYLKESGLLMNRFIVAPGELMLVDDGKGGVTRMSGTSFATPLVSGAVAMIAERWPWMTDKPIDVAHVILSSARDLGDPGTDPVYGRGMLDVEAAMAPLDWTKVKFRRTSTDGTTGDMSFDQVRASVAGTASTWEIKNAYFSVFEDLTSTKRDFHIPLSTRLVGRTVGDNRDQMNWYLQSRFRSAIGAPARLAGNGAAAGFAPMRFSSPVSGLGEVAATVSLTPKEWRPGLRQSTSPYDTAVAFRAAGGRVGLRFGSGEGGAMVDGQEAFGLQSDRDVRTGGANPFLGLATGGSFAAADLAVTDRLTLSVGVSDQRARRDLNQVGFQDRMTLGRLAPYQSTASLASARWRATGWLTTTAGYTLLDEGDGLLGVQSLDRTDFAQGSATDAATLGAEMSPGAGFQLALSGTLGRTRAGDLDRQNMAVAPGGLVSSAWQVALAKQGVFDGRDRARVTFAQPLHLEHGSVQVNQVRVIDRATGEIGQAVDSFALSGGPRRFVAEAMYGRAMMDGRAELGLFGRAQLRGDAATTSAVTLGGSFRLGF